MADYFHSLIFGIYPYIALVTFFVGSWIRYDMGQFTWRAGSSQMLGKGNMRMASNLFHVGIITIFFGHFVGLLMPHWLYEPFMSASTKQLMAIIIGGIAGVACMIGAGMLAHRRLTDPRVRAASSGADIMIICVLLAQVVLGLLTLIPTFGHMDGLNMMNMAAWAQSVLTLQGGAAHYLDGIHWLYKLHIFLGMTIFVLFPFTR